MKRIRDAIVCALVLLAAMAGGASSQPAVVAKLVVEPANLTITAGETKPFRVRAYDAQGRLIRNAEVRVSGPRRAFTFTDSTVWARAAGSYTVTATSVVAEGQTPVTLSIPVTVSWPALTRVEIVPQAGRLYTGVMLAHTARALHGDGTQRKDAAIAWRSSDPSVASVDRFGNVTSLKAGTVTITAETEGVRGQVQHTTQPNPVASLDMALPQQALRTGDVIHLKAIPKRADGSVVADAPVTWSYTYIPDDTLFAAGGAGIIENELFAANAPGRFTLMAHVGGVLARQVVEVKTRDVKQRITVAGRGLITNTHTSDLWPWTAPNGRDYVIVGTWGGDGWALIFDITDLNNPVKTDSVKVDARTINDVTISPDGRYGVIAREGASNRVNGVVLLDLADPAHPKVASSFSEQLTGGVHNIFATKDYLFAVSGGAKYVIIDVRDVYTPKYVSEYAHPNAGLHDLWVHDGIAYSAQGGAGTVVVDVGNGKYGGTIEKPKLISVFPINSGHEIFPYYQKSTGKVYLFIGDEEMSRRGRVYEGTNYVLNTPGGVPQTSGGYTHIVDFTDPLNPKNVARYHIEDYGSHDIIVQDDVLYQAYYDGGVRLVDVSGELLGNLVDQKREIAVYKPFDPKGYTPNAPFVMNAMPWKGHVLFTDFNTGLWAAKIEPRPITF